MGWLGAIFWLSCIITIHWFSPQASLSLNISFPQEAFPSSPRQKYCLLFLLCATTWNQTHCSANWRQKQTWGSRCLLRPGVYSDGGVNGGEYGNRWSNRMTPDKHYGCKIMLWEGGLPWKQYIELLERSCPQRQAYLMPQAKALTGCISRFICKKKLGIDLTAILNCKFLENKNIFFPHLCATTLATTVAINGRSRLEREMYWSLKGPKYISHLEQVF